MTDFNPTTHKQCCHCKQVKPHSAFHHSSRTKDGRWGECKACRYIRDSRSAEDSFGPLEGSEAEKDKEVQRRLKILRRTPKIPANRPGRPKGNGKAR